MKVYTEKWFKIAILCYVCFTIIFKKLKKKTPTSFPNQLEKWEERDNF